MDEVKTAAPGEAPEEPPTARPFSYEDLINREVEDDPPSENTVLPEPEEAEAEDEEGTGPFEIESLCMNCHENGTTKILLLNVPYFRQVLLESFACDACGYSNVSVKSGSQIQEKGSKFILHLDHKDDFERQIIKSDSAIFRVEDLGLEMPTGSGQITNVEGLLGHILRDMESDQPQRKRINPELYTAIDSIVQKLIRMMNGVSFPFTISIDDPAGLSWIAPNPNDKQGKYIQIDYPRTSEQNEALGISVENEADETTDALAATAMDPLAHVNLLSGEVAEFPETCPGCSKSCTVNMQKVDIPHFREVFVMATVCDHCGYKSNEIKTGGAIPEKAKRITLKVKNTVDLSRDLLKSQTCAITIPELEVHVYPGTMGGRFTTVEGLLNQVREDLRGKVFGTGNEDLKPGDSITSAEKAKWDAFFTKLDAAIKAEMEYTLILEDPLASSYIQSLGDENGEGEVDPQLSQEDYERTEEEEEELGLNDMQTEGYEGEPVAEEEGET